MNKAQEQWLKRYQSLHTTLRIGRTNVEQGTAYIYRVASRFYETAFAGMVSGGGEDWQELLRSALEYYRLAVEKKDLENRDDYPFNLARLYLEWHLGEWLLETEVNSERLDQSIFFYLEAIFKQSAQPIANLQMLPLNYLLRDDREHLANYWQMLSEKVDLSRLPAELAFWKQLSDLYLSGTEQPAQQFNGICLAFVKTFKDPSAQPAKFYLGLAKVGKDLFQHQGSRAEIIQSLAVGPWQR